MFSECQRDGVVSVPVSGLTTGQRRRAPRAVVGRYAEGRLSGGRIVLCFSHGKGCIAISWAIETVETFAQLCKGVGVSSFFFNPQECTFKTK